MKIAINALPLKTDKLGGASTYFINLVKHMSILSGSDTCFYIYCTEPISECIKGFRNVILLKCSPLLKIPLFRFIYEQVVLPFKVLLLNADLLFLPLSVGTIFCPIKTVVVIHDLAFKQYRETLSFGQYFIRRVFLRFSLKAAWKIIALTNSMKEEIIKEYPFAREKMIVIYSGVDFEKSTKARVESNFKKECFIRVPYIYYPASFYKHKNHITLLKAFARLKAEVMGPINLVLTGLKTSWYFSVQKVIRELDLVDSVKYLGFVSESEKDLLYSRALFLVFPSLYEGFGFPVLESMTHKCPVLASNIPVVVEVAGGAALFVDAESVDSLYLGLKRLYYDSDLRTQLIKRGLEQVKCFSWEKTARETLSVFEEVYKGA
ncbi:MAG: glycosyltransferase family 1 protein [Thermosphaera sp.]